MTREEQREKASVEYQLSKRPMAIGGDAFADMVYKMNINPSFIAGAKWSDEHPREGLIDIEKALEFILNYDANDYLEEIADFGVYQLNNEKVKTAFYKAMEE